MTEGGTKNGAPFIFSATRADRGASGLSGLFSQTLLLQRYTLLRALRRSPAGLSALLLLYTTTLFLKKAHLSHWYHLLLCQSGKDEGGMEKKAHLSPLPFAHFRLVKLRFYILFV